MQLTRHTLTGTVEELELRWRPYAQPLGRFTLVKDEFVIREGGVPGKTATDTPGSSRMSPSSGKVAGGGIDWANPGVYQHIGYPSVQQMPDGTVVASYHEWSDDPKPLQFVLCTRFKV